MANSAQGEASPFVGLWIGATTDERAVDLVLVIKETDGKLSAESALPSFGSLGDPVAELQVKDGHLIGTMSATVGTMGLDVECKGDLLEGVILANAPGATAPMRMPLRLERTIFARTAPGAQAWAGQLNAGGSTIMLGMAIAPNGKDRWAGSIDIPVQKVQALPLRVTRAEDGLWTIRIPVQGNASIQLREKDGNLVGEFSQAKFKGPIVFKPQAADAALPAPTARPRPQDPKEPFPYQSRLIRVMHPAGHLLEGTLLVPNGASKTNKVPGVLLVTGSGPQDRDESLMGHRPFAVLADALARRGIAVLRCDDRGIGTSTGEFASATTEDFMSDALFEFVTLAGADEVDSARSGIIGHSEGGMIAPMVSASLTTQDQIPVRPAFLVLMAGTGVNGDAILREQNTRMMRAAGLTEEQIEPARAAHAALLDAVKAGADSSVIEEKARALVLVQMRLNGADTSAVAPSVIAAQVQMVAGQLNSPWMKKFLVLDPTLALAEVRCPVLVLNGSLDTQVVAEQNVPPIEATLKKSGAPTTVKVLAGLNHLFQSANTGSVSEYAMIETTIEPEVLDLIGTWILAQPAWVPSKVPALLAPAAPPAPNPAK